MIELYSGTPGSGKSLHAAEVIYWRLRHGVPVIANFPIDVAKVPKYKNTFYEVNNDDLSPACLYEFAQAYFDQSSTGFEEESIYLVIDEAQLLFNARAWSSSDRAGWLSFFSQHRKWGYHVLLIAQYDRMLDRQIRALIEYEEIHRKVGNFGIPGKLMSTAAGGTLFFAVRYWYPIKERIDMYPFVAKKKYYSLYDTAMYFDSDMDNGVNRDGKEKKRVENM